MFKRGTKMFWKSTNQPAYEKVGDDELDWWVSLDSKFLKEETKLDEKTGERYKTHVAYPESEKPLYKNDGSLNRFGFKWTDKQVEDYYKGIMNFV